MVTLISTNIVCEQCGFVAPYGQREALAGDLASCLECGADLREAPLVTAEDMAAHLAPPKPRAVRVVVSQDVIPLAVTGPVRPYALAVTGTTGECLVYLETASSADVFQLSRHLFDTLRRSGQEFDVANYTALEL